MKRWVIVSATAMALSTIGCGGAYVSGYYATMPPPPLQAEFYGVPPAPGFVWIAGYWGLQSGRYVWVPGRWDRPPRGYTRWEAGRWESHAGQYRWRGGRWRR
jgi:hypothetical protein